MSTGLPVDCYTIPAVAVSAGLTGEQTEGHGGALAGRRGDLERAAEELGALAHPGKAQPALAQQIVAAADFEAGSVVFDAQFDAPRFVREHDLDARRPGGVPAHISQSFLCHAVRGQLELRRQAAGRAEGLAVHLQAGPGRA